MNSLSIFENLLSGQFGKVIGAIIFSVAVAGVTLVAVKIANVIMLRIVKKEQSKNNGRATIFSFLRYIITAALYLFGFLIIVEHIPAVSNAVKTVMTAGGLIAVVAGFAAQEALGSIVSGIMILIFKPFVIGDVVRYLDSNISGVIEEITLHHTAIRTYENKYVIIPNSKMNSAIIENADYLDSKVCTFLEIGITYESDLELAKKLFSEVVAAEPAFLDIRTEKQKKNGAPKVSVILLELGESAVRIRASLWAKDNSTAFALKCAVQENVKKAFEENGIEIAYPHMVIKQK